MPCPGLVVIKKKDNCELNVIRGQETLRYHETLMLPVECL